MSVYDSFNHPEVNVDVARKMGMSAEEYKKVCEIMGRTPNYIELGCASAMWSEHCSYKSSRIHLKKLPTKGKDVVYGPGENAGVVRVDGDICICFKIESHNHPSFHDPFNGAATGVGGILRDVFTMGARPIAALNSLRFGDTKQDKTISLFKGAVEGIAYYGNNFGVPTVGGEAAFQRSYATNPLVNAFVLGVVREGKIFTAAASGVGNSVIYIGAKTGREGILGAAMASEEIGEGSEVAIPVSQKGDPFAEKRLLEACLELMQTDIVIGIQDMGAAGLTSTSFEMASKAGSGVKMHLDRVPTKEDGMVPYELMLSESQERMLLVAKKGSEQQVIDIVNKWDLDAAVIGEVTNDGYVRLYWKGEEVAAVEAAPLSDNAPMYDRPYSRPAWLDEVSKFDQSAVAIPTNIEKVFYQLLSDPTIASKKWIWDQFDNGASSLLTVRGGDAAVLKLEGSKKGVAISVDCNSRYCYLNPREGAKHAVAESARNVSASGAVPKALTNCLNYGSPEKTDGMYQLVEGIEGIAEASLALDTPVVSGNVSLYNETNGKAVFPTPTIVVTGVIDKADKCVGSFIKGLENKIIILGELPKKIDASQYLETVHGIVAGEVPDVKLDWHKSLFTFMAEATEKELLESAHDTSEGGLAVALFEMCIKKRVGMKVTLPGTARIDALLFGESPMMILEVKPTKVDALTEMCKKFNLSYIEAGKTEGDHLAITCANKVVLNVHVDKAVAIYEKAIPEMVK